MQSTCSHNTGILEEMYETLREHPELFQALTGLTILDFDTLHDDIKPMWQQADTANKCRGMRLRRVGGGRKHGVNFRERLLVACLCERKLLPTSEIATLYHVHPSTVNRYQQSLRALIYSMDETPQIGAPESGDGPNFLELYRMLARLTSFEAKVTKQKRSRPVATTSGGT